VIVFIYRYIKLSSVSKLEVPGDFKMNVTFFHSLVILLLVILLFNVIVGINIGVLAYLTQFINT
jgi:hypothetical protein